MALMAELGTVDAAHTSIIDADVAARLVLDAVRADAPYVITHPGSIEAVSARHARIEHAYEDARARHPELP